MVVTFGGTPLTAAGTQDVSGLGHGGERQVQTVTPVRADSGIVHDRKNALYTVRFSVSRLFDTLSLAQQFVLDHPPAIIAKGKASLVCELDGAGTRTLANALGKATVARMDGVSVIVNYEFIGAPWS